MFLDCVGSGLEAARGQYELWAEGEASIHQLITFKIQEGLVKIQSESE